MSGGSPGSQAGLSGTLAWPLHWTILLLEPLAGYPSANLWPWPGPPFGLR